MKPAFTLAQPLSISVRKHGTALLGGVVWCVAMLAFLPRPLDTQWAKALLMLAPLVLVPLALRIIATGSLTDGVERLWRVIFILQLPAALLLGVAFLFPQGLPAALLSVPWLATTGLMAILGVTRLRHLRRLPVADFCISAGLIYITVGAVWALLDRYGVQPLSFEPVIVLLTAIHFHYAGFALPVLTGLAIRHVEGPVGRVAGIGVVAAMPMVAIGITVTQLGGGPLVEVKAAWMMAVAGLIVAWLYFRLAMQRGMAATVRCLWAIAAMSLAGSMVLAAMYGSRFYFPIGWLDIPWMQAVHGSGNAIGFGFCGLLGWMKPSPGD